MRIDGGRIKQAREIKGWTQEEFAQLLDVSQPYISAIEQNAQTPSESLLEALSLTTGFPAGFFSKSMLDFPLGSLLYRKTRKIPSATTAQLRQTARAIVNAVAEMEARHFKSIKVQVPRLGSSDPREAARLVRSALGLSPDEPIVGLARRLERSGALVFYLPFSVEGFDAFSVWSDEDDRRPVVCLRPGAPGDRIRRTLGEELGHLVLHQDFLGAIREIEEEADIFSGELLYPEAAMKRELALPLTLTGLAEQKRRWGVSMSAIAHYAEKRNIISARQKQYLRSKLLRRGWLEREPVEIPAEYPRLLRQMVESLSGVKTVRDLAKELEVSPSLFSEVLEANRPTTGGPMAPAGPSSGDERKRQGSILHFRSTQNVAGR